MAAAAHPPATAALPPDIPQLSPTDRYVRDLASAVTDIKPTNLMKLNNICSLASALMPPPHVPPPLLH
eukprot:scaffold69856_cov39-Cyclotella_meneghiniana.AAC.1